ncbi:hypothetical protein STRAU_3342 [Streptomyces aurantiacus JA 4570]|uniref:Uncharacterized protein n=1 Tax=Streptomyces aurantiacus JA 4570 TaxID=1286094 RepID=S3ZLF5_9ACTN|nr:hypothetical protein STRAU_3342 [Streptomyces aurantiacus JA 4570]
MGRRLGHGGAASGTAGAGGAPAGTCRMNLYPGATIPTSVEPEKLLNLLTFH